MNCLPFSSLVYRVLNEVLAVHGNVSLDFLADRLDGCEFRTDLGAIESVDSVSLSRLSFLVEVFPEFGIGDDGKIVRACGSVVGVADAEIQKLIDNDPYCDGLTFRQVCSLLRYSGSFLDLRARVLSLITHDRVFWYNSRIGVRPNLAFRKQPPCPCFEDHQPVLYELVIECLSRIEQPLSFSDICERLHGRVFLSVDGDLLAFTPTHHEAVRFFLDSHPIIFKANSLYWLMPLESEVDLFGGLYMREVYFLFQICGIWNQRYHLFPRLGLLRFPRTSEAACFLSRISQFREFLGRLFRLSRYPSAVIPPCQLFHRHHMVVAYQTIPFAPFTAMARSAGRTRVFHYRAPAPLALQPRDSFPIPAIKTDPPELVLPIFADDVHAPSKLLSRVRGIVAANSSVPLVGIYLTKIAEALDGQEVVDDEGELRKISPDVDSAAWIASALRRSYQYREGPRGVFTYFGFDVLPANYIFASFDDLVTFWLTLLHITSGQGGAVIPISVLHQAMTGKRYAHGSGDILTLCESADSIVIRLQGAVDPPYWISDAGIGLIRFSPEGTGFPGNPAWPTHVRRLPTPEDASTFANNIRWRLNHPFDRSRTEPNLDLPSRVATGQSPRIDGTTPEQQPTLTRNLTDEPETIPNPADKCSVRPPVAEMTRAPITPTPAPVEWAPPPPPPRRERLRKEIEERWNVGGLTRAGSLESLMKQKAGLDDWDACREIARTIGNLDAHKRQGGLLKRKE
jgi:hypothetical protein